MVATDTSYINPRLEDIDSYTDNRYLLDRYLDIPDCGGAGVSLLLGRVPRPVVVRLRVAAEDQSEVSMWSRDQLSTNHSSPEEELWLGEDLLDSAHHRHLVIRRDRVGEERAGPRL